MSRKSRKERKREKQEAMYRELYCELYSREGKHRKSPAAAVRRARYDAYRLSASVRTQRRRVGHMRSFLHMTDRLLRILLRYDRRRS